MKQIAALLCFGLLAGTFRVHAQQPTQPAPLPNPSSTPAPGATAPPGIPATAPQTPGAIQPPGMNQEPGVGTQLPVPAAQAAPPEAVSAQPVPPPPVLDLAPNYVLGVNDVVAVNVWREPSLSGQLIIRPDGRVSMPLIGELSAAGDTPLQLGAEIAARLKKFINEPTVTVTVTAVNSQRIFFVGEINHPGPMTLTPGMTMLQAISAAGGVTPYAKEHNIYILRGPQGKQQKLKFDYKKALKQGNEQGIVLTAGDTIVVPG